MNKNIIKTAGMVLFKDDKVLLVKHLSKAGHITGTYGIPAGRLEKWETEIDCAIRELKEETWLTVNKKDLKEINDYFIADIKRKSWETKTFWMRVFTIKDFTWNLIWEDNETIPEWIKLENFGSIKLLPNMKKIINKAKQIWTK